MISFLFDRDFFAPRPQARDELQCLIRGGRFDSAMKILETSTHKDNFDGLDSNGLSSMHLACAAGAIEVVVELLSQGADVNLLSSCGSSPLHYAAMNNRKGIVEVLLRSGADASLPDANGLIPAELCSHMDVRDVLLRERDYGNGSCSPRKNLPVNVHERLPVPSKPNSTVGNGNIAGASSVPAESVTPNMGDADNAAEALKNLERSMARLTMGSGPHDDRSIFSPGSYSAPKSQSIAEGVLRAARETAEALKASQAECDRRRELFKCCQQIDDPTKGPPKLLNRLRTLLEDNPSLARVRAASQGAFAADGATLLHCAAQWDNVQALQQVLSSEQAPGPWAVDLQGRTALHLAAEWGKDNAARVLRSAMAASGQRDPVGVDAPGDLTGTTPLGWASRRSKGRPSAALQEALFSPGDSSILPRTPHTNRAKTLRSVELAVDSASQAVTGPNVSYAFSEAAGWRGYMEDRVVLRCPMPGLPDWALFGVLDGHGGEFAANFLSQEIPTVLLQQIMEAKASGEWQEHDSFYQRNTAGVILRRAVLAADERLKRDPRMRVTVTTVQSKEEGGAARTSIVTQDSSGSTAVLCFLSTHSVVVANVGDSRAVLARRNAASGSGLEAVPLTVDHKLDVPMERERADQAGGIVEPVGEPGQGWQVRAEGHPTRLRMARSMGDFYLKQRDDLPAEKQIVTADPDILVHHRSHSDAFVLLACDGVFDVMTNQRAVDFLADKLGMSGSATDRTLDVDEASLAAACDALLAECLRRGSSDNMTAIVVLLGPGHGPAPASGPVSGPVSGPASGPVRELPPRDGEGGDGNLAAGHCYAAVAADITPVAAASALSTAIEGGSVEVDVATAAAAAVASEPVASGLADTPSARHYSPIAPNSGPEEAASVSVVFVSPGPSANDVVSPIRATRLFSA